MHSMGLHSALAIKRQRKRRDEQRRARERRYSQQSNESGLGESNSSFVSPRSSVRGRRRHQSSTAPDALVENKMMSSVGMLHIGVVFLVLGGFLLGSGLLPEDLTSWSQFTTSNWWNELTIAGGCAILLGVFLIVLNRYMARREEEDLTEYVQRQLTRSRSGHRLVRDVETGALTNKHSAAARSAAAAAAAGHGHGGHGGRTPSDPDVFASVTDSAVDSPLQSPAVRSPPHHHLHCDLEQILEEDGVSDRGGMMTDLMAPSPGFSPAGGVSPGSGPDTPVETRELLHHHGSGHGHHGGGHGHHGSGHGPHGSGHGHHGSGHGPHGSGHGHHGSGHGPHGGGHGPHGDDPHGGHNFHSHHHQSHHMVAI